MVESEDTTSKTDDKTKLNAQIGKLLFTHDICCHYFLFHAAQTAVEVF